MTNFNAAGPERAKSLALRLIESGKFGSEIDYRTGKILEPISIQSLEGNFAGWFVGFTVGPALVGFFVFNSGFELQRYSTFLHSQAGLKSCPRVDEWLDSESILQRARSLAQSGEHLKEPFLSYDQSLDRLAWVVRAVDRSGDVQRIIFVAGEFVYVSSPPENELSTG